MERHGGGDDGEMMISGNKGVVVCVEYSLLCNGVVLCWVWWNMAVGFCVVFVVSVHFFLCAR